MGKEQRFYIEKIRAEINKSRNSRLWKDSVNLLSTVSESIFSRSALFILELLQNAEDACSQSNADHGEITFRVFPDKVEIQHNGAPFTETDVDAICGVRSSKKPELGTLGYLGIGFKSVFKVTDAPEVHSGGFHFKFDKGVYADPANEPWQIMPIWIDSGDAHDEDNLTKFALPFRHPDMDKEILAELRRVDVTVFLFLKQLKKLTIVEGKDKPATVIQHLGERDRIVSLSKRDKVSQFVVFRSAKRVPDDVAGDPVLEFYKRQRVNQREVVVAFGVDPKGNLRPIEEASTLGSVSSFLPLVEERSGAKFLIQSDFLVQPGREAIQYEIAWNQWLLKESAELVKQAVNEFKNHPTWRVQFPPLLEFTSYPGQAAYERLFKPCLHDPLRDFLKTGDLYPTASGIGVRADKLVCLDPQLQGLLGEEDLQFLFPAETNLHLADSRLDSGTVPEPVRSLMRNPDIEKIARCKLLLDEKAKRDDCETWFVKLYTAMSEYTKEFRQVKGQDRKGRIVWCDSPIYVLTEQKTIAPANSAYLREIPSEVQQLRSKYPEVDAILNGYKQIHPCLGNPELVKFFKDRTHVCPIDYRRICEDVFLPKLKVASPPPSKEDAITYARLLQKGPRVWGQIWVVTKNSNLKPSGQVFLGKAFSPAEDWETNAKYCRHMDFLSDEYLQGVAATEVAAWKEFLLAVGVKEKAQEPYVSQFAVALVKDKLSSELGNFISKERQQQGYDLEATRADNGMPVYLEVKGNKKEDAVELIGNEPKAANDAKGKGHDFWLCIVPGIPENPELWIIDDPLTIGESKSITIELTKWKTRGRRVF